MLDCYQLEALDRTLRDLMKDERPFGGKMLVLSGDSRQWVPVVPSASRAGIVDKCLNQSFLWHHFMVLQLIVNMRMHASGDVRLEEFDKWLLSLGDGTAKVVDGEDSIKLPYDSCTVIDKDNEKKSMAEFCSKIFPNLDYNIWDGKWLEGRAVLAPTNREVDKITQLLVDKMSGQVITLHNLDGLDND